jgi:hypothetical protein
MIIHPMRVMQGPPGSGRLRRRRGVWGEPHQDHGLSMGPRRRMPRTAGRWFDGSGDR